MTTWRCALELDEARTVVAGSPAALADAIGRAADLRIYTEFLHNEHIDVDSPSRERIREVAEFGVTYLVDQKWAAGIMSLRQPIELPVGFGPRSSMSFFLYNQDGTQRIARPYLDGRPDLEMWVKVPPISDLDARQPRGDRRKRPAVFDRGLRFEVVHVDVARSAPEHDIDDRLLSLVGSGPAFVSQQAGH